MPEILGAAAVVRKGAVRTVKLNIPGRAAVLCPPAVCPDGKRPAQQQVVGPAVKINRTSEHGQGRFHRDIRVGIDVQFGLGRVLIEGEGLKCPCARAAQGGIGRAGRNHRGVGGTNESARVGQIPLQDQIIAATGGDGERNTVVNY